MSFSDCCCIFTPCQGWPLCCTKTTLGQNEVHLGIANIWLVDDQGLELQCLLTLNAPIATIVVCFSRLLKCVRSLYGKQCGPRSQEQSVLGPNCLLLYLIRQ